jgi:hypothetical protein
MDSSDKKPKHQYNSHDGAQHKQDNEKPLFQGNDLVKSVLER